MVMVHQTYLVKQVSILEVPRVAAVTCLCPSINDPQGIDMIEAVGAEDVDPLDALIVELERIQEQQTTLKDAVQHGKPIVVHPRKEVGSMQQVASTSASFGTLLS